MIVTERSNRYRSHSRVFLRFLPADYSNTGEIVLMFEIEYDPSTSRLSRTPNGVRCC